MPLLDYLLPFLILIGVLVTVHEWGHYYAARLLGIHATHFSLGMGPVLLSRVDRRGTRWQLSLLPIGGYVRFLGDKDGSSAAPTEGMRREAMALPETERRRYLHLRGPGARAIVIFAGPAVNLVLGFAIFAALYVGYGRPTMEPVVKEVVAGPALEAGVRAGDRILSVNGRQVRYFTDVKDEVALYPGGRVEMQVRREGEQAPLRIAMTAETATSQAFGVTQTIGRIGIVAPDPVLTRLGLGEALSVGVSDSYGMVKNTLVAVGQIVSGARPIDDVGGPVRMAEMSAAAAKAGTVSFVVWIAVASMSLAVFNLFPIPVLDGGQLVLCAWEAVTRRPVNERVLGILNRGGVAVLGSLMVLLTAKDVWSLISRHVG